MLVALSGARFVAHSATSANRPYHAQRPQYENDNYNINLRRTSQKQDINPTWRRDGAPNIDEQVRGGKFRFASCVDTFTPSHNLLTPNQPFPQDLVRRYVSDKRSKFVVAASSSAMGYMLGVIISLVHSTSPLGSDAVTELICCVRLLCRQYFRALHTQSP